jgi:hypothetical protein
MPEGRPRDGQTPPLRILEHWRRPSRCGFPLRERKTVILAHAIPLKSKVREAGRPRFQSIWRIVCGACQQGISSAMAVASPPRETLAELAQSPSPRLRRTGNFFNPRRPRKMRLRRRRSARKRQYENPFESDYLWSFHHLSISAICLIVRWSRSGKWLPYTTVRSGCA